MHRSNGVPTQQVQVLLVDDSMAFLELAGEVFDAMSKSEWKIHQAVHQIKIFSVLQTTTIAEDHACNHSAILLLLNLPLR